MYPTLFNSPWLERKQPKHLFFVATVSKETQVIEFGHILTKDQINVAISNAFCKFEPNTKKQHQSFIKKKWWSSYLENLMCVGPEIWWTVLTVVKSQAFQTKTDHLLVLFESQLLDLSVPKLRVPKRILHVEVLYQPA